MNDSHLVNGSSTAIPTGPITVTVSPYDVLAGVGKIDDVEFGIAATDEGVRVAVFRDEHRRSN